MNYRVALNLYNESWLIERNAALHLASQLDLLKEGRLEWSGRSFKAFETDDDEEPQAVNPLRELYAKSGIVFAPDNRYDMREFKGFEGAKVAVIPFDGPMMKGDFCGYYGTASMRNVMKMAGNAKSVETVLFTWDTPGGTVNGTSALSDDIYLLRSLKNTISLTEGMMCSAGYWGGSSASQVFVSAETDIIGSIGTMISWYDFSAVREKNGVVLREYYATKSTDKNKAYRDAEKGDGKALIEETLDPMNNAFIAGVKRNRDGKLNLDKYDVLTGKTYVGSKAVEVGLADDVKSFDEAINYAMTLAPHKQKTIHIMSGTKLPFQKTLTAAKAESFGVTDAGFVATEEQLNNLEAHLTTAEQNAQTAQANLEAVQTQLTEAQGQATAAATTIQTLEQENQTLKTQAESFQKAGASFFGANPKAGNDPAADDDTDAILAALPHNQKADRMLNP